MDQSTATDVTFVCERLMPVLDQLMPLAMAHDIEIDGHPESPLDIDREAFAHWEDKGALRCYLMRNGAHIVGYAVFLVVRNPFKRTSRVGSRDHAAPGCRRSADALRPLFCV